MNREDDPGLALLTILVVCVPFWALVLYLIATLKIDMGSIMQALADFFAEYAGWMPTAVLALILTLCTVAAFIWAIAANVDGGKR